MCYVYDQKEGRVKRAVVPVVRGKLKQTEDMRAYLEELRERYKVKDWDKEVSAKIKLKPAKV